jgi:plastocyanin
MRKTALAATLAAVALNASLLPAEAGSLKKVNVGDDYYGPTKLTVKKGTTIKWVWLDANVNTHNVKLKSGPAGVKKFTSPSAASQFTFKKKLTVPGKYKLICTLHKTMTMTIVVKK